MERGGHYDVIVAGGGAAGLAAAIGARDAGRRVLLIERSGSLGGQATNANVTCYCGFFTHGPAPRQVVWGVGQKVLEKLRALGFYQGCRHTAGGSTVVMLDVEGTKLALDELALEHGVDFLLRCAVVEAETDRASGRVLAVRCADDAGYCRFEADAFVDATGDGNLGALAGAPFQFGDGQGGGYVTSRVMRVDRVDPDAVFSLPVLEAAIRQAKADGLGPLTKEGCGVLRTHEDTVEVTLPSVAVPALDAATLTRCEVDTRRQSYAYMQALRRYVPGMERARLVWTGSYLGVRDGRHLLGEYTLTGRDVLEGVRQPDAVARGAWPCEMHEDVNSPARYRFIRDDGFYDIPLRALKVRGLRNLWSAGRTISADHVAFASVRVMGTGFATGHAAGVAAALSGAEGRCDAQAVRRELERQDARLE